MLDLTVEDPPIEDVIELVFAREAASERTSRDGRAPRRRAASARWPTSTWTAMRTQIQAQFQYRVATYM